MAGLRMCNKDVMVIGPTIAYETLSIYAIEYLDYFGSPAHCTL